MQNLQGNMHSQTFYKYTEFKPLLRSDFSQPYRTYLEKLQMTFSGS